MQEFCGDIDTVISSFHIYKERNDDKLYFGPVLDYDIAFDNDGRLFPTKEKDMFCYNYGASAGSLRHFITKIIGTNNIMNSIYTTWIALQEDNLKFANLKNFIDNETEKLKESTNLNNLRWYGSEKLNGTNDYKNSVQFIIDHIEVRFDNLTFLIKNYDSTSKLKKINNGILAIFIILLI